MRSFFSGSIIPKSIRWRLPLSYAAIALFTTVALGLILLAALRSYYRQQELAYLTGNAQAIGTTLAPLLEREDGRLDFGRSAAAAYDRFRGVYAWPGTWFEHGGRTVRVEAMHPADAGGRPGRVLAVDDQGVTVACSRDALRLVTVKPAGKAAMRARDWANGYGVAPGVRLGAATGEATGEAAGEAAGGAVTGRG